MYVYIFLSSFHFYLEGSIYIRSFALNFYQSITLSKITPYQFTEIFILFNSCKVVLVYIYMYYLFTQNSMLAYLDGYQYFAITNNPPMNNLA